LFGAPGLVMTRLPGAPNLKPADVEDYLRQMAAMLVRLHQLPVAEFDFLPDANALLSHSLAEPHLSNDVFEPTVRDAVLAHWPAVAAASGQHVVLHGDYWPGNLVWRRGRLLGVVDWEDARLGDPSQDVGITRGDLTVLFGSEAADAFVRHYESMATRRLENLPFWDLLACTHALSELERWLSGWQALGRRDVSVEMARERMHGMARRALEALPTTNQSLI
jgi:aminoglycoside phosphotransferase (APT) family kinase protein